MKSATPARFVKRTGGREDDDASDPLLLHGVEDVTNSLREDLGGPSPCGGPEGDEDGLLTRDRPVDGRGIEDVSWNDMHRITGGVQAGGVAHEGRHYMAAGDGSLDQQTARLA